MWIERVNVFESRKYYHQKYASIVQSSNYYDFQFEHSRMMSAVRKMEYCTIWCSGSFRSHYSHIYIMHTHTDEE